VRHSLRSWSWNHNSNCLRLNRLCNDKFFHCLFQISGQLPDFGFKLFLFLRWTWRRSRNRNLLALKIQDLLLEQGDVFMLLRLFAFKFLHCVFHIFDLKAKFLQLFFLFLELFVLGVKLFKMFLIQLSYLFGT
jgi:hypothetical protein